MLSVERTIKELCSAKDVITLFNLFWDLQSIMSALGGVERKKATHISNLIERKIELLIQKDVDIFGLPESDFEEQEIVDSVSDDLNEL